MTSLDRLLDIMARLRDPAGGCPWDLEQDFASIAPYTIEEAYEVADAIARGAMDELKEELGDLLLQVVFHSRMAQEAGHFAFADVAQGIADKMIRRHPHVFDPPVAGTAGIRTARAQTEAWEAQKARERAGKSEADTSALKGVARALPALMRAQKLGSRAAGVGFDWPNHAGAAEKIREELAEVEEALSQENFAAREEEIGDLLFAVVNLARHAGVDAEVALRAANAKFERRFRHVEHAVRAQGATLAETPLEIMEMHWQAAKSKEKQ